MAKEEIRQLEQMIEVVMRAIPRERQAHDIYQSTSEGAQTELARQLFRRLAEQEEQHEAKLRAALELLKDELSGLRGHRPEEAEEEALGIHDQGMSRQEKLRDLERVIEVVIRMIPREREAHQLYQHTAEQVGREMTHGMFEWLAAQELQHESKLRGILRLLRLEASRLRERKD